MATQGEITHHKIRVGKFCLDYEVGNPVPVITDADKEFVSRREITPEEAQKVWRFGIESSNQNKEDYLLKFIKTTSFIAERAINKI